jgi:excisionase family DNA binding protein
MELQGRPVTKHEIREKQTSTTANVAMRLGGSNRLIGVRETAERLDVPVSTLYKHWREWQLTAYRVGRALKFRERDIEAWLERQRVDGVA